MKHFSKKLRYRLFILKKWVLLLRTDIVIATYPKTGSTWLQLMIRTLLVEHFHLGRDRIPQVFVHSWRGLTKVPPHFPRIYITHAMPWFNEEPYDSMTMNYRKFERQKVILLSREPKDTLVSLYFHNCFRTVPPVYQDDINSMVYDPIYGIKKYLTYYKTWYENRKFSDMLLLIRYEDVKLNPMVQLKKISDFIGISDVQESTLQRAIDFCSFEQMKEAERQGSTLLPGLDRSNNLSQEAFKVREGLVGGYKKYLSAESIHYIDTCTRSMLPAIFGYQVE